MKRKRGISSNHSNYTNLKRKRKTSLKNTPIKVQDIFKREKNRKISLFNKDKKDKEDINQEVNLKKDEVSSDKKILKKTNKRNKSTIEKANAILNNENSFKKDKLNIITKNRKSRSQKSIKLIVKNKNESLTDFSFEKDQQNQNSQEFSIINSFSLNLNIMNSSLLGPKCLRLGLCCINNFLRAQKQTIFCSRGITLATYKNKGKSEAIIKATKNITDIKKLLQWNKDHYIDCLRLSSDMFPHYTNINNIDENDRYDLSFAKKILKEAGDLARTFGHRITMHPGQYNVVATPNEEAFEKTIADLKMHADILDMMGMDNNSIMVVHGGGVYGDKQKTVQRWIDNFKRLPKCIRKRLVLENCEKNFSIIDCLQVNKAIGIPIVFDNHHFECYKQMHPQEKFEDIRIYIKLAIDTWVSKGLRPKFHISEQAKDRPIGTHSDYIKKFPDYYLEIPDKYGIGIDIMVEAKAKEAAIFSLYKKYSSHFLKQYENEIKTENIEELFAFSKDNQMAVKCEKCKF